MASVEEKVAANLKAMKACMGDAMTDTRNTNQKASETTGPESHMRGDCLDRLEHRLNASTEAELHMAGMLGHAVCKIDRLTATVRRLEGELSAALNANMVLNRKLDELTYNHPTRKPPL